MKQVPGTCFTRKVLILNWSIDGQTPEFLAATRMVSLGDAIVETVLGQLQLKPGMRVLDVGCGSGEYCFRLGSAIEGIDFTGFEYDPGFVEFANQRAMGRIGYPFEEPSPSNEYRFVRGDGLDLPFEDGSFDAVVSHTYLTAVPDWACALAEMCRVCKPGGTVSSITSMTDDFYGTGTIGLFTKLFNPESADVLQRVENAKAAAFAPMDLVGGMPPRKAPVAFDWIGLERVRCAPLAHYACLSDAATTESFRRRYVDLLCAAERNQLERLKARPETRAMLDDAQWDAYERLIELRRRELAENGPDREWNWYGNSSLLVCGTKPSGAPEPRWSAMRDAARTARKLLGACGVAGCPVETEHEQLGPGRCLKVRLLSQSAEPVTVFGFDPPRAILEACGKLANRFGAFPRPIGSPLRDAANLEREYAEIESRIAEQQGLLSAASMLERMPGLPNDIAFNEADIWEAVSEAALSGMGAHFKNAGMHGACSVVGCLLTTRDGSAHAIAAHHDIRQAARRAFARALGALCEQQRPQPPS